MKEARLKQCESYFFRPFIKFLGENTADTSYFVD